MNLNNKMPPENNKKGGIPARVGFKFSKDIKKIIDTRLRNGKSKDRVSIEKITNMITKHESWGEVMKAIINAPQGEVDRYGE